MAVAVGEHVVDRDIIRPRGGIAAQDVIETLEVVPRQWKSLPSRKRG
jgi:hypothetical protein